MMTHTPESKEVVEILEILGTGGPSDFEFVKSLIEHFPDGLDAWLGRHWITNAIDCGSTEAVKWVLQQKINLTFRDDEGYTVLHSAIERPGVEANEIIRMLIAAGADVNAHGVNDWTPLHMAVARGKPEIIEMLLEAGADRSIRTRIDDYETAEEMAGSQVADFIRNYRRSPANWRPTR